MLNGLERALERKVPMKDRRWQVSEDHSSYEVNAEYSVGGWPIPLEADLPTLTPDT